jgi:NADPH-dependent glutamate synthase beta subunit-like oxidoreductase
MTTGASSQHIVAVVGGATAGAEAAAMLADQGARVVVFEQKSRPYGKIEDGLPRWHTKLRRKEYETINERLDRPGVDFVPLTKIGRDVDFRELATDWGFSAIVLAHGAWRDRPLPIDGADEWIGRGLLYQNPLIYWFNHFTEAGYDGPRYRVEDGAIVVGGGLASIDVLKVLQIETVRGALIARGIHEEMDEIEVEGVGAILARHGLTTEALGLKGATLYYRRRIEDMPLTEVPGGADAARAQKFEATRRKILEKAMAKYGFHVRPLHAPVGLIVENGRLAGLRFQRTRVDGGKAVPVAGAFVDARAPLIVSSIGSVPEPMRGIPQDDLVYRYVDPDLGRIEGFERVFGIGNVVTGKGNILVSRRHSLKVTALLVEQFLGLGNGRHAGEEALLPESTVGGAAAKIGDWVREQPRPDAAQVEQVLARVRARQEAVGYRGPYREWIARVTPPDLS